VQVPGIADFYDIGFKQVATADFDDNRAGTILIYWTNNLVKRNKSILKTDETVAAKGDDRLRSDLVVAADFSFSYDIDYGIVLLGLASNYTDFPYQIRFFEYVPYIQPPGVATIMFFNAAVMEAGIDLKVTREIPGEFNYRNVPYGTLGADPVPFLDIKPGDYSDISLYAFGTTPNDMKLYIGQTTFDSQTWTLLVAVGVIGDPSLDLSLSTIYIPL